MINHLSHMANRLLHDLPLYHDVSLRRARYRAERAQSLEQNLVGVLCYAHLTSGRDEPAKLLLDHLGVTLVDFELNLVQDVQDFFFLIDADAEQRFLK